MKPVYPLPRAECRSVTYAKDQPEYTPLPANVRYPYVETKWRLSWRERLRVLFGGHVYLTVMTFGQRLQPVRLTAWQDVNLGGA